MHNLKNISLEIPKNKLVVFSGVSGSGKSSLAFDTIYAEGQRRYVESLSAYARQFLGLMEKPDVDLIEGLSPAISIDQKSSSHNPRSTVGTVTEIYDYLRLLFARIGHPHCPNCGREVKKMSAQEIVDQIMARLNSLMDGDKHKPLRFMVMSPVVRERRGEFKELFDNLRFKGYSHTRIDNYFHSLEEDLFVLKNNKHNIDVVTDRLSADYQYLKIQANREEFYSRLFKAVEQALLLSEGLVIVAFIQDSGFAIPDAPKDLREELYSERFSCPVCNISFSELEPRLFSFNSPVGACDKCKGLGAILKVDESLIANPGLSIAEGAIFPFQKLFFTDTWFARIFKVFLEKYGIEPSLPLTSLSDYQRNALYYGAPEVLSVRGRNRDGNMTTIFEKWNGIVGELEKKFYDSDSEYSRSELERYMKEEECPKCHGEKLKPEALSVTVDGRNIHQVTKLSIKEELAFFQALPGSISDREKQIAGMILKEINSRLVFLDNVGLGYLDLARRAKTLSGGEAQRIRLASQIGTGLTGITYVLDEPSIGLHSRDVSRLLTAIKHLRDLENTVIVVEHDRETIDNSDWVVDFGPKAGKHGGEVVYNGTKDKLTECRTSVTGDYLAKKKEIRTDRNETEPGQYLEFKGCGQHNLKDIDVRFPLERMTGVTGVSGSGKSTLLLDTVYPVVESHLNPYYKGEFGKIQGYTGLDNIQRAVLIDQSPIGRTPRSNPATYTGVFTYIREVFAATLEAKAQGYKPGRFSFNVKGGRCENCQGAGVIRVEMQFLADVYVKCDVCQGRRYNTETLSVQYKGKSIDEVLSMSVDEAHEFLQHHWKIRRILKTMQDVGLGYIELGQPAPTLSGGEAQRVKLAKELYTNVKIHTLYLLDEPTTGLHMYDVDKLIKVLRNLVHQGNTVVIIEHNLDVIKNCDYIIDLGPEGGEEGGRVVFQGPTRQLPKEKKSYTGQFLEKYLNG